MTDIPAVPARVVDMLFSIDIEGSGLNVRPKRLDATGRVLTERAHHIYLGGPGHDRQHEPGVDPDCILEVGYVSLDGKTLKNVNKGSSLVLPPGVKTAEDFDKWCEKLAVADAFVFKMHTDSGLLAQLRELAARTRQTDPVTGFDEGTHAHVEIAFRNDIFAACNAPEPVHPGNSKVMFLGNSIANYDIPMFRMWMPEVLRMLSYRIMDVSILRSFTGFAGIELPGALNAAIKSGGGGHRALEDALFCAESFRQVVDFFGREATGIFGREATGMFVQSGEYVTIDAAAKDESAYLLERIAHLEMLVRYGRRGAIKEERKRIEMRDAWQTLPKPDAPQGIFRTAGGILKASADDVEDEPASHNLTETNGHGA
jgi:oligoribonuclease (3'-5' exoribonuclease)